jgi:uncharacterized protein YpuA (DUF1002 family)
MSDISPINRSSAAAMAHATRAVRQQPVEVSIPNRQADKVELSTASRLLSRLSELPDIRHDLVNRVRAEIANGRYETDDKLNAAIDNLAQDL